MTSAAEAPSQHPAFSLLLFVATPAEEEELKSAAKSLGVNFEEDPKFTRWFEDRGLTEKTWSLGTIGAETVLAVGPSRERGRVVMGAHGRLGSAAKAIRYLTATGAQGIIQVGVAFGVSRESQKVGDVLVSSLLSPYDNRTVTPRDEPPGYQYTYPKVKVELPRLALLDRFRIEKERGGFDFKIHIGPMLSGAARIQCAAYRDELLRTAPRKEEEEKFVGGEMEGVGLLSGSARAGAPVWCVVKGISDFADEDRDEDTETGRKKAAYNAAFFVLSSLKNDAKELAEGGKS